MTVLEVYATKDRWWVKGIPNNSTHHGPYKSKYNAMAAAILWMQSHRNDTNVNFRYCLCGIECGGSDTHILKNGTVRCNTCKKVWFY